VFLFLIPEFQTPASVHTFCNSWQWREKQYKLGYLTFPGPRFGSTSADIPPVVGGVNISKRPKHTFWILDFVSPFESLVERSFGQYQPEEKPSQELINLDSAIQGGDNSNFYTIATPQSQPPRQE
jgi:hypothetical protein